MDPSDFLRIAREKIDRDPRSRLSALVKEAVDNTGCVVDVHTHIFDKKCLNVGYILLRLLKSKVLDFLGLEALEETALQTDEEKIYEAIREGIPDSEEDWKDLEDSLENILELTRDAEIMGFDLKEAKNILRKKSMLEVLDLYLDRFSLLSVPGFEHRPLVTVVLMMDLETGWGIRPKTRLSQQITEIRQIMPVRRILPFLPLDPRRAGHSSPDENLYDLFLRAFTDTEYPFFGVKCYQALGYLPSDARLDPIFEICAEKNIPVMTHCGGEIVSTFEKEIEVQDEEGFRKFRVPGENRTERARYLNNPELWAPVLNKHKGLKLAFGHFGGDTSWENLSKTGHDGRISKLFDMMHHSGWKVFTDFSFNVVEAELFDAFRRELENHPGIADRIMFGTDYWVVVPAGDLAGMQIEFLEKMKPHQSSLLHTAPLNFLMTLSNTENK